MGNDPCQRVDAGVLERVRYFPRQLISANDMIQEQEYFKERLRRHNRFLHGWGVVWGLEVTAHNSQDKPWAVKVSTGFALSYNGDEVYVPDEGFVLDLAQNGQRTHSGCENRVQPYSGCGSFQELRSAQKPKGKIYVVIDYTECMTRPVRVGPAACGCDETVCEYSRVRDSFKLERLHQLDSQAHQIVLARVTFDDNLNKVVDEVIEDRRSFSKAKELPDRNK